VWSLAGGTLISSYDTKVVVMRSTRLRRGEMRGESENKRGVEIGREEMREEMS
jgi:hypothetical protein